MANIQERRDKTGKLVSYSIRVHRGRGADGRQLKPWTATFDVAPTWTEKSARKKAEAFAATFEKECKEGTITDTRQTFEQYAKYVLELKESSGAKTKTMQAYRYIAERVFPAIGHIKLSQLRPQDLNKLYQDLQKEGSNKRGGSLSPKTVLEHHRFISTVLSQAEKEGLVPFNAASRATPPKVERKDPEYLQPGEVADILEAAEHESPKWSMLLHLLAITGCRRGEVLGLKWEDADIEGHRIHVSRSISYTPDRGVFEGTPKTASSIRWISVPASTVDKLRQYRSWQAGERLRLAGYYKDRGFVFAQDDGSPLHPDSITAWLTKFSKKYGFRPLHPHMFRHSAASALIYGGLDVTSTAKRLGHSRTSTTLDVYAHLIQDAEQKSADILSEAFLKHA